MRNTKHITTGAITIALTSLLILLDRITSGLFMGFLALPLIIYGYYNPLKPTIAVAFGSVLMSFVLTGYLPMIITVAGYSLIGLTLVYSRNKGYNAKITYFLMYLSAIPVYGIMIAFFGEYFGLDYQSSYDAMVSMMPQWYGTNSIKIAVILSIAIMPLLEAFIMRVSSILVLRSLTASKKFKSNGKPL